MALSLEILLKLRGKTRRDLLPLISEKQYYLLRSASANASHNTLKKIDDALQLQGAFHILYLLDRLYTLGARIKRGALVLPPSIPADVANAIFRQHPIFDAATDR